MTTAALTRDPGRLRRATYAALIVSTQLLDALALVVAWGHGAEANPLMAASIGALGLGGIVALKLSVGTIIAAIVWLHDFRFQAWFPLICLVGSLGALSALIAVYR